MGCQNNDIEVLNGSDTSFGKLQGKWIVVNYWADWCAPCIKEIPELVEFAEENKDIEVNITITILIMFFIFFLCCLLVKILTGLKLC